MTPLRDEGPFLTEYAADEHNIAEEFYAPCLANSTQYWRITGFFSSLVYVIAWDAMRAFLLTGEGQIRMICSPRISPSDLAAFRYGYEASTHRDLVHQLNNELDELLAQDKLRAPTRLLACLYSLGRLKVQFAKVSADAPGTTRRMFHDKVGLFIDEAEDVVGFRGSMNETFLGLSPTMGHIDSVDVFPSWLGGREEIRAKNALDRFEHLWSGGESRVGVEMSPVPPAFAERLDAIGEEVDLETALSEVERLHRKPSGGPKAPKMWDHQEDALAKWEANGRRGILAHATGSGKTFTGCEAIRRVAEEGGAALVIVPSVEVQRQWQDGLRLFTDAEPVLCGGDGIEWKSSGIVRSAANSGRPFTIVAIVNTVRQPAFLSQISPALDRLLLVGDEVHRLGAPSARVILEQCKAEFRLGLSATPERAGDPQGTTRVFDFFGKIVDRFQIAEALKAKKLTPYDYRFETVSLNEQEQSRWNDLSRKISSLYARLANGGKGGIELEKQLQRKLQDRAKIKKQAASKVQIAQEVLRREYQSGQRWLVYCDDLDQLGKVREDLKSTDIPVREYHSQMRGDRAGTLQWLAERGGVVVSIRCLDEGVDIPSASHGLILASSTNPREFIQRRGRLLRKEAGKHMAWLWDVLVEPADTASPSAIKALLGPELGRALLFARHSESPSTVTALEDLCLEHGFPLERLDELANDGVEMDE